MCSTARDREVHLPDATDNARIASVPVVLPFPGVRQLLAFPTFSEAVEPGARKSIGRIRGVLIELDRGGVYFLETPREWQPESRAWARIVAVLNRCVWRADQYDELSAILSWECAVPSIVVKVVQLGLLCGMPWNLRAFAIECALKHMESNGLAASMQLIELTERFERGAGERLQADFSRFCAALAREVLSLADPIAPALSSVRYNYLAAADRTMRRNRIQAVRVFPQLCPLVTGEAGPLTEVVWQIAEIVDSGRPLVDGMAEAFGGRRAAVRHLLGCPPRGVGWERHMKALVRSLSAIAPERYPKADEWSAFLDLVLELLPRITGRPYGTALNLSFVRKVSRYGWTGARERLAGLAVDARHGSVFREFLDTYSRALAWGVRNEFAGEGLRARALGILDEAVQSIGPVGLVGVLEKWPGQLRQAQAARQRQSDLRHGRAWESVISGELEHEGVRIVPLADAGALEGEGTAQSNCVGSYAVECRDGGHLFSLRLGDDRRLGVVHLRFKMEGPGRYRVRIIESQGVAHGALDPSARKAIKWLVSHLRTTIMQERIVEVEMRRRLRKHRDTERDAQEEMEPLVAALTGIRPRPMGYPALLAKLRHRLGGGDSVSPEDYEWSGT